MKYLLDTNICIYLMKNHPPSVAKKLSVLRVGDVVISTITLAELEQGIAGPPELMAARRNQLDLLLRLLPALPFDQKAATAYGNIRKNANHLGRNRFDCLIAAQALASNLTLVTNNLPDFQGIEELNLENWI